MAVNSTLLFQNAVALTSQVGNNSPSFNRWGLEFQIDGRLVPVNDVIEIRLVRDFVNNFSDELSLEVFMPLGDYVYDIYPNRKNLRVTLSRIPINPQTGADRLDGSIVCQDFKAVLIAPTDYTMLASSQLESNRQELNRTNIHRFRLQLIDPIIFECRAYQWSGTVFNQDKVDLLTDKMTLPDSIKGITCSPLTAPSTISNLVIPDGIDIVSLPGWMQRNASGLYNAGCGWYLQRGYWWIYPLYDTSRYESGDKVLTIVNIPESQMSNVEATFLETGSELYLISTGQVIVEDKTDGNQLTTGTGIRVGKQSLLADDPLEEEVRLDRQSNLAEVKATDREDTNIARFNKELQRENSAHVLSQLARTRGTFVSLKWENSMMNKLDPGMPVRLLYEDGGTVVKWEGTLLGVEHLSVQAKEGIMNRGHTCHSQLSLFLNRDSLKGANDG